MSCVGGGGGAPVGGPEYGGGGCSHSHATSHIEPLQAIRGRETVSASHEIRSGKPIEPSWRIGAARTPPRPTNTSSEPLPFETSAGSVEGIPTERGSGSSSWPAGVTRAYLTSPE